MFSRGVLAAALVSMLWGGSLQAGFVDGNELHESCLVSDESSDPKDFAMRGLCRGYILAIFDALDAGNVVNGYRACFAVDLTASLAEEVAKKWLENHPEKRHLGANGLVAHAFEEAFPCKK